MVLLSDNCPSHLKFNQDDYPNVQVVFFPLNMTSHIQPMDAGIIWTWKAYYRLARTLMILDNLEADSSDIYGMDQLEAMNMALDAWRRISPETVQNCWKHTGILQKPQADEMDIPIDPKLMASQPSQTDTAIDELSKALEELNTNHVAKSEAMTAEEWIDLADERITEGQWSEDDLIQQVQLNKCKEMGEHIAKLDDPEPVLKPEVTHRQALDALDLFDRYLSEHPSSDSHRIQLIHWGIKHGLQNEIRLSLRQPKLDVTSNS